MPINGWMKKQYIVYADSGILLFGLKKNRNSDTGYHTDEPWGNYAKWNKPVAKRQILYDSTCLR